MQTFRFHNIYDGTDTEHAIHDPQCPACWFGETARPCRRPGCTGFVHTEFGDEDPETSDYFLIRLCDVCGDRYQ